MDNSRGGVDMRGVVGGNGGGGGCGLVNVSATVIAVF